VRGGLLQIPGKHGDVSGRRGNRGLVRSTAPPTTVVAGVGAYGDRNALVAADDRVCGAAGTGRQAAVGAACTGVADVHYPLAVGPLTCVHIGRIARSLLVVHIPLAAVRHLHVSTVTPLLRGERCTTPQGLRGALCTPCCRLPAAGAGVSAGQCRTRACKRPPARGQGSWCGLCAMAARRSARAGWPVSGPRARPVSRRRPPVHRRFLGSAGGTAWTPPTRRWRAAGSAAPPTCLFSGDRSGPSLARAVRADRSTARCLGRSHQRVPGR